MTATAFLVPATREEGAPVQWENVTDVEPLALGTLGADEVITLGPLVTPYGEMMVYANARPAGYLETNAVAAYMGGISHYPINVRGPILVVGWKAGGPVELVPEVTDGLRAMTLAYRDFGTKGLAAPEIAMASLGQMLGDAFKNGDTVLLTRVVSVLRHIDPTSAALVETSALLSGRFPAYVPTVVV